MFSPWLVLLYFLLLCIRPFRRIWAVMLPWLVFACSYDALRLFPNYTFNDIDIRTLYDAEKALFGIVSDGVRMIPGEYFARHHHAAADFLAGIFYLCWVPVPLGFAFWLALTGKRREAARFSWAFLTVNLVGFCGYYLHPAAAPWYVMQHGFEAVEGTLSSSAGLARWDAMTGTRVFHFLYGQNSNVFAAVPSLHAAYVFTAFIYAWKFRAGKAVTAVFAVITLGIWWTAVYTGHHYVIDVLLGILTALIGTGLTEFFWHSARIFLPLHHSNKRDEIQK